MKSDVIITIENTQKTPGNNTESTLTTVGKLWGISSDYHISYSEQDDELKGSETELHVVNDSKVTMTRRGNYSSMMIFEPGQQHHCFYNTPFGELNLGVFTKKVKSNVDELGGKLKFSYTLDANNEFLSENTLNITIKRKDTSQCQC